MSPTESPWLLVAMFSIPGAALAAIALLQGKGRLAMLAGVCGLAAAAALVADVVVVTDRERVEANITSMVRAFEAGDKEGTLAFVSPRAACERMLIGFAIEIVTFAEPLSLKDYQITLSNENSIAVSTFRANGSVLIRGHSAGYHPSQWKATWRKEGGEWRMFRIQELDPIRGEPIERLHALGAKLCD